MLKIFLFPLSLLYSFFSKIKNFLYNRDILRSSYFNNNNVIIIGNLAIGGTGKTPHTEFIVNNFKDKFKIAVLSRGYKRKSKGFRYVDLKNNVSEFGDEVFQIKSKFKDTIVAVSKNRVKGLKKIFKENKIDVAILDDAFQHRRLKPSLSILLTEFNYPFFKDHFFPVGKLRDNKSEYSRADIIIISNCPNDIKPIEKTIWRDDLKLMPYQKIFFTTVNYTTIVNLHNNSTISDYSRWNDFEIIIVTGISNPNYFIEHIENNISKKIHTIKFSDHQNYSQKEITLISKKIKNIRFDKKIILTTEKDAVKLKNIMPENLAKITYFQNIEIKLLFNMQNDFEDAIIKSIENKNFNLV